MARNPNGSQLTTISLPLEVWARINKQAELEDRSKANMVQRIVREYYRALDDPNYKIAVYANTEEI